MDYDGLKYSDYWNQVTPENGTKWGTVEGTRGSYYWEGSDPAFNYAKNHGFPFKFHALVWGSQYPEWIESLSYKERYNAIVTWYDVVKKKYPQLQMIDVVNEAIEGHQPGTHFLKEALGGGGKTGYDWLIKAFEMAYERWPDAILIYNDFNTFTWQKNEYIDLVRTLRDAGAPIDAYGNQSHDLGGKSTSELQSVMKQQQDSLKMPMYISEYDIQDSNDANQKWNYQQHIPSMWEADYCAGVTLWGWIYGKTWMQNLSGIVKDKQERSALTWLREYVQTDAAKNATGPFPGAKKEASVYIRPAALKVAKGDVLPIKVHASMATKTIEKVELYMENTLVDTKTDAPYLFEVSSISTGTKTLKAIVTATDGSTYERYGRFQVLSGTTKREPYNETVSTLPTTIKAGEFDKGESGVAYYNVTRNTDKVYVNTNSWMEYTVDVAEEGDYSLDIEVASANDGGMLHLSEYTLDNITYFTYFTEIPNTGSATDFVIVRCPLKERLAPGRHVFCLNIDNGGFYVKSLSFKNKKTFDLPGIVEAEDFCQGGNGFNILSDNNGYVISNTATDASVDFSVNVVEADKYNYEATVSSVVSDAIFAVDLISSNGTSKRLGAVTVPKTGSKDTYTVKEGKFRSKVTETGLQTLRFTVTQGSCNIDKVKFISANPSGIDEVENADATSAPAYNLYGMPVGDGYRGIVIKNGKKILRNK